MVLRTILSAVKEKKEIQTENNSIRNVIIISNIKIKEKTLP